MKSARFLLPLLLGVGACEEVRFVPSNLQVDTFQQAAVPQVDILWIVDNSGTMREERQELGNKFDQFMSQLMAVGADYHLGIITTDADDPQHAGRLQGSPPVISQNTPDPRSAFIASITNLAETENRMEKGLDAMLLALSEPLLSGHNQGFLRPQASLYVIALTDEDDHSLGPTRYYARWLEHLKGRGEENRVSFSALVGQKPSGCEGAEAGLRYLEVQELTGGLHRSICEKDYGPVVTELGIRVAGMRRKFYLSGRPSVETLRVFVHEPSAPSCQNSQQCLGGTLCGFSKVCTQELAASSNQWSYQSGDNAIFFGGDFLPPPSATIEVAYKTGGH